MLEVKPTRTPAPPPKPTRNLAPQAHVSASNEPVPVQYWIRALNDGVVRANPLPPDMWGSWTRHNPASQWVEYAWTHPVTIVESRVVFWGDHPQGAEEGVAPPASWHLEYWTGSEWQPVRHPSGYPTQLHDDSVVRFDPVTTDRLHVVFNASGHDGRYAAVAVQEWETLAPSAQTTTR